MIGRTISRYKIIEKIREGGVGVVYRAEDTKLKRTVALRFLSPELIKDPEAKRHFVQEAQAASVLEHANICAVYEVDEVGEDIFIAMAYVDGPSLKKKIKSGPMDCHEAVTIAIQVAEGLREAHKKGLVHQDIEPGNIMLTSRGQAKIVGFGLAGSPGMKQVGYSRLGPGSVMYMSPEKVSQGEVDRRTDIWSLGAVLYEMVSARAAFTGANREAVTYSILNEELQSPSSVRPGISTALERVILKAMARDPGSRHQSMDVLLAELRSVRDELSLTAGGDSSVSRVQSSIAVLPFANITNDKEQDYFCDGIAEDITKYLARVEGLRVAAVTSAFAFKGRNEDIREIGRKLGVAVLLEGSVRTAGKRLRISAQLVSVADGYHIWSDRYDRELKDVFAIQDEIAQQIVLALKLELTEGEALAIKKGRTRDVQAYDFYLRGRRFLYLVQRQSYGYALEMFSRAIEKDPGYALAFAGIADSYSFRYMYDDGDEAHIEESLKASRKALELNPDLAEGHAAYGLALSLSKRYEEADAEFEKAIRLNVNLFEAFYFFARNCYAQGRVEKACHMFEEARRASPENYQVPFLLAMTYRDLNRPAEADTEIRRGMALIEKHIELNPDDSRAWILGASGLAELGEAKDAIEWAEKALSIDPNNPITFYVAACMYSRIGQSEKALDCLEKVMSIGSVYREWIERDSDLDSLRKHARYRALINKEQ